MTERHIQDDIAGPDAAGTGGPDDYQIKLEIFEGPLDLLLYLIRKEEVSVYDIPIARIAGQYLDYLSAMEELDIAVAGEFLLMAATLIHIKSQTLIPRDPQQEELLVEDPRTELVHQLIEHQKFKAAANALYQRATIEGASFGRAPLDVDDNNPEITATIFQLFELFKKVLDRQRAITEIEIAREEITMAEKITAIRNLVAGGARVNARKLFESARSRREMVLIFLGILELVKEMAIRLEQDQTFGDIVLFQRESPGDQAGPSAPPGDRDSADGLESLPTDGFVR